MGADTYRRASDLVWRLGPDRVLVHRVGDVSDAMQRSAELVGGAALVWIACELPLTRTDIERETGATADVVRDAIELLVEAAWLEHGSP